MSPSQALAAGIERRAEEMYRDDSEGMTLDIPWTRLDESLKAVYRNDARKELEAR